MLRSRYFDASRERFFHPSKSTNVWYSSRLSSLEFFIRSSILLRFPEPILSSAAVVQHMHDSAVAKLLPRCSA